MNKLTTKEIANALGTTADNDVEISCICIDTRKVKKGSLFVCIKGENFDGNIFADKAVELGASAVLCNDYAQCSANAIRVKDTRKAFLDLSSYYRQKFDIPVVALTGSVGKTTTKEMTALVLSAKYNTMKTQGNFNNEIGLPQTLFTLDDTVEAAVIEMGMSHFGEISVLSKATKANVGLITNIGVSHIENLGSQEGIFKAKMEILDGLTETAPLIVNGDDKFLSAVKSMELGKHKVFTFGLGNCDFTAKNIVQTESETTFEIEFFDKKQNVKIPTIGIHNVYDALAGFAVGFILGVDSEKSAEMLSTYAPAGMRQKVNKLGDVTFIEDCYNASPDSMKAIISALISMNGKSKILVLADMLELGKISEKAHYNIGSLAAEYKVDLLLAYGEMGKYYISGAKENGMKNAYHFETKVDLTEFLFNNINIGDVVAFKASRGMKMEEVIHSIYDRWENK